MKRILVLLMATVFLVACGSTNEETNNKKESRNDAVANINDNIDAVFATDSLTDIWHIEDHVFEGEELDSDRLFKFTDKYIMDEDEFESLNEYEQGLAMKTSAIITKAIKGKYEDEELIKDDLEEYIDILENGDDVFTEQ